MAATLVAFAGFVSVGHTRTTSPGKTSRPVAVPSSDARVPRLTKPIDEMSPVEFTAYVQGLDFGKGTGHKRMRKCRQNSGDDCKNAGDQIEMEILPEEHAKDADPAKAKLFGQVVAKIKNSHKGVDDYIGIPAEAKDVYWVVLNRRSIFISVKGNDIEVLPMQFTFERCHLGDFPLEADFQNGSCNKKHKKTDPLPDAPPWVSCAAGCCIAKAQPEPPPRKLKKKVGS
jgi:hypothetical protein